MTNPIAAARDVTRRAVNADLVGRPGGALDITTPALVVDLPILRRNIRQMADMCAAAGIGLRPHAKTHKCAEIAREQIAAGAAGVCCATPHEAVALARSGINSLLLTAPVVQPRHFDELAALLREGTDLKVVVDSNEGIAAWERALAGVDARLPALVDIDIGMARTGVTSPEDAVGVAQRIDASGRLSFAGVQAYSGRVQHIESYGERRQIYLEQIGRLGAGIEALTASGFRPGIITGGGTGTFAIDLEHGLFTECQVGSYIFMDVEYDLVELFGDRPNPYDVSLFLRTSVISANVEGQVTVNAGFKSFATDGPEPVPYGEVGEAWAYQFYGDEYGRLLIADGAERPVPGDRVDLATPHCDPTINLHDFYHVVEDDTLVDIWSVAARGVL